MGVAVGVPAKRSRTGETAGITAVAVGGPVGRERSGESRLLSQTVWGVAKTALYVYAAEGEVPSQFENFELETLGGRTARTASPGSAGPRDAL